MTQEKLPHRKELCLQSEQRTKLSSVFSVIRTGFFRNISNSKLQIVRENILLGLTLYDIKCKTCTTNGVCKPCNGKVEILGKSITWICPWNFGNIYPMFKTDDTMRLVFNFDQNTTPVQPPPSGWSAGMFVISRT